MSYNSSVEICILKNMKKNKIGKEDNYKYRNYWTSKQRINISNNWYLEKTKYINPSETDKERQIEEKVKLTSVRNEKGGMNVSFV